jgi:hypothetical protein
LADVAVSAHIRFAPTMDIRDPLLWNVDARFVPAPDFPGRLFFASLQLLRLLAKPLRLLAFALAAPIVCSIKSIQEQG